MAYLHIPLSDFWNYTPLEIDFAFKAYHEKALIDIKTNWERTRIQVYYAYLLTASKKRKVNYRQFKREYLPFAFDEEEPIEAMSDETFDSINDFFNNTPVIKTEKIK